MILAPRRCASYMGGMDTRLATDADIPALTRLVAEVARSEVAPGFSDEGRGLLDAALTEEAHRGYRNEGVVYHLAEEGGRLLGVVAMRPQGHLLLLFVDPQAQGRGVAWALWQAARDACRAAGHAGAFTVSAAPGAVAWYEKVGFRAEGPATDEHGMIRLPMRLD